MAKNTKHDNKEVMMALAHISNIGVRIAACVLIGVLLGRFLDTVFGTSPGLLLVFSLFGAGAAFKLIFDGIKK